MSRRKSNPQPKHKQIRRERDPLPWKYCFLTVVCGLVLLAGFFGAARQHFASIEYSIKNSKLKKQIEELESEKRSLINARETALAPSEILKAAKKYGFARIQNTLEVIPPETRKITAEKVSLKKISDEKTVEDSKTEIDKKNSKDVEKKVEKSVKDSDSKGKKGTTKKDADDAKSKVKTAKK
jgi:hypothetical protein